jgi:hypothetical protein
VLSEDRKRSKRGTVGRASSQTPLGTGKFQGVRTVILQSEAGMINTYSDGLVVFLSGLVARPFVLLFHRTVIQLVVQ